jgi:hypothetical protein
VTGGTLLARPDPILSALAQLETRIVERVVARVDESAASLRLEMNAGFGAVHRRLDRLEIEYEMLKAGMARIEQDVAILKAAYGDLTAAFEDHRNELARQSRLPGR